jgi:hypothetical protein
MISSVCGADRVTRSDAAIRVHDEVLYAPFALVCWLVRVPGAVVHVLVLPVCHSRQELPPDGPMALQLIGRDHACDVLARFELEEELLRGLLVAPTLHQTALSRAG